MRRAFILWVYVCISLIAHANNYGTLSHSAQVSLLTNSPGDQIYTQYGHTALRVTDSINNIDLVFNYGIFDFSKGNFAYRFAKGETDYQLGIYDASYLYSDAAIHNITITEQVINLTQIEKQRIFDALMLNYEPKNRVYRYNYWFDNCSTRPFNIIKEAIEGVILFADSTAAAPTFRDVVNHATRSTPWNQFGINLALGKMIDRPLTFEESFFLPAHVMRSFANATIQRNDTVSVPLVLTQSTLIESDAEQNNEKPASITPQMIALILLLLVLSLSFIEYRKRTLFRTIDASLWTIYGIIGVVLWFLMLFSQHPATGLNASTALFHPFYLLFAFSIFVPKWHKNRKWLYIASCTTTGLFVLLKYSWSQEVPSAISIMALILIVRSILYFLIQRNKF